MKARIENARRSVRQKMSLTLVLMGIVLSGFVVFVPGSGADLATPPNTFEGNDGNLIVDNTDPGCLPNCKDWATISPMFTDDVPSGSTDNSFTQGTEEDAANVTIEQGSIPPNKNDLTRSYIASSTVGGHTYLYLAWERAINTGSANIDFELNQQATTPPNGDWNPATATPVTLNRTEGDLLVTYDFGGSGTPDIGLLKWLDVVL